MTIKNNGVKIENQAQKVVTKKKRKQKEINKDIEIIE